MSNGVQAEWCRLIFEEMKKVEKRLELSEAVCKALKKVNTPSIVVSPYPNVNKAFKEWVEYTITDDNGGYVTFDYRTLLRITIMALTTEQIVQVAKDRAVTELTDLVGEGYWHLTEEDKQIVKEIGKLLSLPDNSKETLILLDSYINGEEEMYFKAN